MTLMPKSKPKKMKTVRLWAVVSKNGDLVTDVGFFQVYRSQRDAVANTLSEDGEERTALVEIREVSR